MINTEKLLIKLSILQGMLGYDMQDLSKSLGYSRSYLYKLFDGSRKVTKNVEDTVNMFIIGGYGSTMLELLDQTIELVHTTETGKHLLEGYRNAANQ